MPLIILETVILAPIDIVFGLSRSIDLHKESTKDTKEEAISGRTTGLIKLNESVTWKAVFYRFVFLAKGKDFVFNFITFKYQILCLMDF